MKASPIFKATASADGTVPVGSLLLQVLVPMALEMDGMERARIRISCKADLSTRETILAVVKALYAKHLAPVDSHGDRKDMRRAARELIIDTLANKPDWSPYAGIFHAFAQLNDREFFEQVVLGAQRTRKAVFSPDEWFLILNWHGWESCPAPGSGLEMCPPLKYWTDEAVLGLIQAIAIESKLKSLPGLRSKRTRLALTQAKSKKVRGCFPVAGKPGHFYIEND